MESSQSSPFLDSGSRDDWAQELSTQLDFVRRLARSLVRDEQIAEDMVQETMLAAVAHRPVPSMGLRVWLQSVLRRSILLHFRTEQRRVARETLHLREKDAAADAAEEGERALASLERATMLGQAVARLSDPYRTVIVLRFYEGLAPREIAARLDRSVHTVNTQLQRGVQKLRESLDESHGGDRSLWIGALLPYALHGPEGWWPSNAAVSVGSSSSLVLAAAFLVATAAGLWMSSALWSNRDPVALSVSQAPIDGPDANPSSSAEPSSDRPRGDSSAAVETTSKLEEPRLLQLQVLSPRGAVVGARVVAKQESKHPARWKRVQSPVRRADGLKVNISSGGLLLPIDPPDQAELESLEHTTGSNGRVELALFGQRRWTIRIEAEGYSLGVLRGPFASMEQVVTLEPATEVVIDRGAYPLHCNVYCKLGSGFQGHSREVILPGGQQMVRIPGVRSGAYFFEALSSGDVEVAQWNMPLRVQQEKVLSVDLSTGIRRTVQVDVRGADASKPPYFIHVHAHTPEGSKPTWNYFAPVHSGLATFEALPVGLAVFRVLSKNVEIGRSCVSIAPGPGDLKLPLFVPLGRLRVLHTEGLPPIDCAFVA